MALQWGEPLPALSSLVGVVDSVKRCKGISSYSPVSRKSALTFRHTYPQILTKCGFAHGKSILTQWRVIDRDVWQRMVERARRAGLRAYRLNGDPRHWAVTSASDPEVAYEVTILDDVLLCSCTAAAFRPSCKQRALVLATLGLLDEPHSAAA